MKSSARGGEVDGAKEEDRRCAGLGSGRDGGTERVEGTERGTVVWAEKC